MPFVSFKEFSQPTEIDTLFEANLASYYGSRKLDITARLKKVPIHTQKTTISTNIDKVKATSNDPEVLQDDDYEGDTYDATMGGGPARLGGASTGYAANFAEEIEPFIQEWAENPTTQEMFIERYGDNALDKLIEAVRIVNGKFKRSGKPGKTPEDILRAFDKRRQLHGKPPIFYDHPPKETPVKGLFQAQEPIKEEDSLLETFAHRKHYDEKYMSSEKGKHVDTDYGRMHMWTHVPGYAERYHHEDDPGYHSPNYKGEMEHHPHKYFGQIIKHSEHSKDYNKKYPYEHQLRDKTWNNNVVKSGLHASLKDARHELAFNFAQHGTKGVKHYWDQQDKKKEPIKEGLKVGDYVHLGLKVKGGAGYYGNIKKIDGKQVHIQSKEQDKYGPRTYIGHIDNATLIKEDRDFRGKVLKTWSNYPNQAQVMHHPNHGYFVKYYKGNDQVGITRHDDEKDAHNTAIKHVNDNLQKFDESYVNKKYMQDFSNPQTGHKSHIHTDKSSGKYVYITTLVAPNKQTSQHFFDNYEDAKNKAYFHTFGTTKESLVMEISKQSLGNYVKKAVSDRDVNNDMSNYHRGMADKLHNKMKRPDIADYHDDRADEFEKKANNREKGIHKAIDRLTKESLVTVTDDTKLPTSSQEHVNRVKSDFRARKA